MSPSGSWQTRRASSAAAEAGEGALEVESGEIGGGRHDGGASLFGSKLELCRQKGPRLEGHPTCRGSHESGLRTVLRRQLRTWCTRPLQVRPFSIVTVFEPAFVT